MKKHEREKGECEKGKKKTINGKKKKKAKA